MKCLELSAIICLILITQSAFALEITEIMYDFPAGDDGHEWIEVFSSECVNLEEWRFYEGETNHHITHFSGPQACGYAIIAEDPITFLRDYPNFEGSLYDSYFQLKNSGENIAMKDPSGTIIDSFLYPSVIAHGNGLTIEKNATSWYESLEPTPGRENSIGDINHEVAIQETPVEPENIPVEPIINEQIPDSEPAIEQESTSQEGVITEIPAETPNDESNNQQSSISNDATGLVTLETDGITVDIDPIALASSLLQALWDMFVDAINDLIATANNTTA